MSLTLLHTAEAHCATFDRLRDKLAPGHALSHLVREDFLDRAQSGIDDALKADIAELIGITPGVTLCTCTTLGPVAAGAGAIRIDQPMMQAAAALPGDVLMAYCLDSTLAPSLGLLEAELARAERPARVHPLPLKALWPLFEAGETLTFGIGIAAEIRHVAGQLPDLGSIVLAQASMAGAADHLKDQDIPVLTSPELALRAALARS